MTFSDTTHKRNFRYRLSFIRRPRSAEEEAITGGATPGTSPNFEKTGDAPHPQEDQPVDELILSPQAQIAGTMNVQVFIAMQGESFPNQSDNTDSSINPLPSASDAPPMDSHTGKRHQQEKRQQGEKGEKK